MCDTGYPDIVGQPIRTGDIIEYFDDCYCNHNIGEGERARCAITHEWWNAYNEHCTYGYAMEPLFGVVEWDSDALTFAPIVNDSDHDETSAIRVCSYNWPDFDGFIMELPAQRTIGADSLWLREGDPVPSSYVFVLGNVNENPELLELVKESAVRCLQW